MKTIYLGQQNCDPCSSIAEIEERLDLVADDVCSTIQRVSINEQNISANFGDILNLSANVQSILRNCLTGVTLDNISGVVIDNVAYLSTDYLAERITQNEHNIRNISGELTSFEEEVADDINVLSGAIDSKVELVELSISGDSLILRDNLGNESSVNIPTCEGDNITIVKNGNTFSIASSITENIENNTTNIENIKNTMISGVSVYGIGSGISVSSSITQNNVEFGVQILTEPIVQYLYNLLTYTYYNKATTTNITIDLTQTTSGTATATLVAQRYRGLDYPTYTPTNPEEISVVDSTSESGNWTKSNATKWTYVYNVTDTTQHSATADTLVATIQNSDGVSGETNSVTPIITIKKPWVIVEGIATPTESELDNYLTHLSTANLNGVGNHNGEVTFTINTQSDYFFICVPSNKEADYLKMGQSQINGTPTNVRSTTYGDYKIYQSKAKQNVATLIGTLTITNV